MARPTMLRKIAALLVAGLAAGCAGPSKAEQFGSAEQALEALIKALRADDSSEVRAILGAGADEVLSSGDEVADKNNISAFLASYDEAHKLVQAPDGGGMILVVGSSEWPLPIPLVETGGHWAFDTEAGLDELLSRRIGRNELDAIQVCLAICDAEREYASMEPRGDGVQEYAQKFMSDPGKKDGLYWPAKEGEPESPLGPLVAEAQEQGYAKGSGGGGPHPYHGYYFRILTSQSESAEGGEFDYVVKGRMIGGFAVVAYPAEYGNSGIMTFIVNHAGVVYEKDFGEMTADKSRSMTKFGPGAGWKPVPPEKSEQAKSEPEKK
jgi:DUF2950 family protein